jgi:hypothetical protein
MPKATADMEITGVLLHDAELRNSVVDHAGHTVPVICLDLVGAGPAALPVRVQWPQPAGGHHAAEQLIKTLKRGTTVTVQAPLQGMHLVASQAHTVHASAHAHHNPIPQDELF